MKAVLYTLVFLTACAGNVFADVNVNANADVWAAVDAVQTNANYVWLMLGAILVFFMQAGFAMVETGFTRAKNAINILMKNLMDYSIGALVYFIVGFGLMFGASSGLIGTDGFFLGHWRASGAPWDLAFWMFQAVFSATAVTIVSGAMAERTRFNSYLIATAVICAFIYPIFGGWVWNAGGWLAKLGFIDFAGSTVVHSLGGWVALAGALAVGPRLGKYSKKGQIQPIPGHNIPLAALGVFVLWVGWFGFNCGSTTEASSDIAMIFVNTNMAAATGAIFAMALSWIKFGKPEISLSLNGALAGLVGITAGCANVSPFSSIIIGAVAGLLVVVAVLFFERIKIDDPVGAISVHGVCGAWGTLAAGLFNMGGFSWALVGVQIIGILACFVWGFCTAFILFLIIKKTIGLRASEGHELMGLDYAEHGGVAYPDFEMTSFGRK